MGAGGSRRASRLLPVHDPVIHLDTCFLIQALGRDSVADRRMREWLRGGESLSISAVGWAEFLCGPLSPSHIGLAQRVVSKQIPFDAEMARRAAELFNATGRRRGSLLDCMIAATAVNEQASFATMNPSDFRRLAGLGLRLIDIE